MSRLLLALLLIVAATTSSRSTEAAELSGLWRGIVTIDRISAPGEAATQAAAGSFRLPILLHVNRAGQTVLLKEVVVLPGPDGERLLADPAGKAGILRASAAEDLRAARRFETAGFDFPGALLQLDGALEEGTALTGTIELRPDLPTHPFAHRFHPDHDNRDDSTGAPLTAGNADEVPGITREIRLDVEDMSDRVPARAGAAYVEIISGLAARPIRVEGRVALIRVSTAEELD